MRRRLTAIAIAVTALVAGSVATTGAQEPTGGAAATRGIDVRDNVFRPSSISVRRGTVLRFVWRGTRNPHNVCASGRCSRTTRRRGFVYRRTVRRSTTYVCTIHPQRMRLRVRVR